MNRSESKYFNTAVLMDQAFLAILEKKDFEYITVKEICEKAGVNRSTFYLHYENMNDLLEESIRYMGEDFQTYFSDIERNPAGYEASSKDELYLVTPEYLTPYLIFIKEHRRVFKTALSKGSTLGAEGSMELIFTEHLVPILDRYGVPEKKRKYMISFYVEGIIAVIKCWLKDDCRDSIPFMIEMITDCVQKPKD